MATIVYADRVRETTVTTGTGNVTLAGPVTGFRSFSAGVTVGPSFYYSISSLRSTQWEIGEGHLSASSTLVRDSVISSSNSNALVDFSTGTKDVWLDVPSSVISGFVGAGTGDVVGPASATAGGIVLFNGTTGKLIKLGTFTELLDLVGSAAQGDILYRNASAWTRLGAGTSGQYLKTLGAAANPAWANPTAGRHAIYIPASRITPSATGGSATLATIATSANRPDVQSLNFDTTTQEYAQFSHVMPKRWNEGTVTFVPHWSHAATTVNFGVVWSLQGVAVSNDDTIDVAFGTEQTSTDTGGTTNDLYTGPESSAITIAGAPAAEDMVFFRISRVTGNGSDTMAIDARLHGITLYITTDADTDT